jgi:hypothetical protein
MFVIQSVVQLIWSAATTVSATIAWGSAHVNMVFTGLRVATQRMIGCVFSFIDACSRCI